MKNEEKVSVLFVCLGNICRSPTAEGTFRHLIESRGLASRFDVDSCGTGAYHTGERADSRARQEASRRGISLDSRARALVSSDFERFDFILAADLANLRDLKDEAPADYAGEISLLLDYAPGHAGEPIPDPYYGGTDGFRRVFDLVELGCEGLLDHVMAVKQW